jgi:predicted nucleic acid-binding protein
MPAPTRVDTDILIDAARGVSKAVDCLDKIKSTSSLSISIVAQMELIVGCRNKTELRALDKLIPSRSDRQFNLSQSH